MKRFLMLTLALVLALMCFMTVCFAEEATEVTDGAVGVSYADKEQAIRDIIDTMLNEGDELWAEQKPWEIISGWVREHLGEIVAGLGGLVTLVGSLLVLLKTNPRLKAYLNSLGKSCKTWFEGIINSIKDLLEKFEKVDARSMELKEKVSRLEKGVMALVVALEDVIKLSGADEGKKEIYIKQIEQAKAAVENEK